MSERKNGSSTGQKNPAAVSTAAATLDLETRREYARNQAATSMQNNREKSCGTISQAGDFDDRDMDHLFRSTQALIATNSEIWERCQGSKSPSPFQFRRLIFDRVVVSTMGGGGYRLGGGRGGRGGGRGGGRAIAGRGLAYRYDVEFIATAKIEEKDFGAPGILPESLTELISKPKQEDSDLPDYMQYLERALTLHDSVLQPFLARLKDHLEDMQVYLGAIDSWLMESTSRISFLEETFKDDGVKIEPGDTSEMDSEIFLKEVVAACGQHELSFDIANESHKTKLKKFLDFISD